MRLLDILDRIISGLDFPLDVLSYSGASLSVKNVKFASKGRFVTIMGTDYQIKAVDYDNNVIELTEPVPIGTTTASIPTPFFFHGTAQMQNEEWTSKNFDSDKFPCIYLREVVNSTEYPKSSGNIHESENDVTLYLINSVNFEEWTTDDHYKNVLLPLEYVLNALKNALENDKEVGKIEQYSRINRVNLGVFSTDKGNTQAFFTDRVSAIELGFNLPIKRGCKCINC